MLKIGEVVSGSHWPETIEIKKYEKIDASIYLIEALGRSTRTYYETLLESYQIELLERLNPDEDKQQVVSASTLQRYLQFHTLQVDQKFSTSRALGNKKVIPLPHQIEAVYGRMLQAPQTRFLLADDPGAGKTIMSGMLIRELRARKLVDRILILVPPIVLKQWQEELQEKFDEDFKIITRTTLDEANGKNPFEEYSLCLASLYWAARDDIKDFLKDSHFDLIIVDEAHKMAAYTEGVKKKKIRRTKLYQLGDSILRHAEHRLLLTATPHKGDVENFRHLMRLVDEDIFSSIGANETIREKSNPFVIRRIKEKMVQFDGAPLFPERTANTIEFDLSSVELELYQDVTTYVREHFNRAEQRGNTGTTFAMMLLQRRLSSSIQAIHLSLRRRHEKLSHLLETTLEERENVQKMHVNIDEDYEEDTYEVQEQLEEEVESAFDSIDTEELKIELTALGELLYKSGSVLKQGNERKYVELEETIFGEGGLLKKGEKILIFTEATDTLHYLEERLLKHVPQVAKIVGKYSMDERRRQVELFRNEVPIMLATDAGGESINLQFCNQMVNYDIPWNPNRLEQRMGRIHRIGQKNEVFIFNLVAGNTREGDVMRSLLNKMEQMRKDLGHELVYDFIGDVLEDNLTSLSNLMQEAILNRQSLNDIIQGIDRTLSREHKRLLEMAEKERLDEDSIDLPGMRREQHHLLITSVPKRIYSHFTKEALVERKVKVFDTGELFRIDRFPKSVRDFARKKGISLHKESGSIRFTSNESKVNNQVQLVLNDHPLFQLALASTDQELQKIAFERINMPYPFYERLEVEASEISIGDGTGRELLKELIYLAKRENGDSILLDPYWLFGVNLKGESRLLPSYDDPNHNVEAIRYTQKKLLDIRNKREDQLNKKNHFLRRTFEAHYVETTKKLTQYRSGNHNQQNSALINQMNAQLIEIEEKRDARLAEIERERSIQMRPPKRLFQLVLEPLKSTKNYRLIPSDYTIVIEEYESSHGRTNVKELNALGLVDFYSESIDGEPRYIILTEDPYLELSLEHRMDLGDMINKVVVYYVNRYHVIREMLI